MANSLYWYDYETFGLDPSRDGISQFAGIRTNERLEVIGEPLTIYCYPPIDRLPSPEACLVTGITPQIALEKGIPEKEFIQRCFKSYLFPIHVGSDTTALDLMMSLPGSPSTATSMTLMPENGKMDVLVGIL